MDNWNGFKMEEFTFLGKRAVVVFPKESDRDKNWAIKTEYWGAFSEVEVGLLNNGFHLAYLENRSRFATKDDCDAKAQFAELLCDKYGLNPKCVTVGMSLGGAHAMNFAGLYPDKVRCMFIDAPVLNFASLPGKLEYMDYEKIWDNEFLVAYPGMTRARLLNFDNHPIGKAQIIKNHKIPIIMAYGTEDKTVIYEENGKLLELEFADSPELLTVIPRYCQGHHPHGGFSDTQKKIVELILEKCNK